MMGRFSCQRMSVWQAGHRERGWMMEISLGIRWIQTLRKLPIHAPKTNSHSTANGFSLKALCLVGEDVW